MLWVEATAPLLRATITAVLIQPRQPGSCLLSFRNVPSLTKAVKQSNGHPNIIKRGAAGGVSLFRRMPRVRSIGYASAGFCIPPTLKRPIYAYSICKSERSSWGKMHRDTDVLLSQETSTFFKERSVAQLTRCLYSLFHYPSHQSSELVFPQHSFSRTQLVEPKLAPPNSR
jgi:hypothetical protein